MDRNKLLEIAKPILFNTDMVRAILEDRKTETRRLIKPPYFVAGDEDDPRSLQALRTAPKGSQIYIKIGRMPYPQDPYKIGSYMYVRETWCSYDKDHIIDNVKYAYKANETAESEQMRKEYGYKWHPSIHMPKEAARIFLKVTDVRVEKLQDITEEQADKEGCINSFGFIRSYDNEYDIPHTARQDFITIWDSTVPKKELDQYGWEANPWVWVIEFKRVEVPDESI